jgi:hypothetical protein
MRWTVRRKLAFGFGAIVALVAVSGVVGYINATGFMAYQKRVVFRTVVARDAYDTLTALNYCQTAIRNYAEAVYNPAVAPGLKNNLMTLGWARIAEGTRKIKEKSPNLRSDEQRKLVAALAEDAAAYLAEQAEEVQLTETDAEGQSKLLQKLSSAEAMANSLKASNDVSRLIESLKKEEETEDIAAAASGSRAV